MQITCRDLIYSMEPCKYRLYPNVNVFHEKKAFVTVLQQYFGCFSTTKGKETLRNLLNRMNIPGYRRVFSLQLPPWLRSPP
jgi:hypothetical protein